MSPKYEAPVAAPTARRRAHLADGELLKMAQIADTTKNPEIRKEALKVEELWGKTASAWRRYARDNESKSPYRPDSIGWSYFNDLATKNVDPAAKDRLDQFNHTAHTEVERFAIGTGTLGGFLPTSIPPYIAEAIAWGIRSSAPLAGALEILPLPPIGMNVPWAKVTTAATVGVQTSENTTISASADTVVASATDPIRSISASADFTGVSQDQSGGWFDIVLGQELGRAFGAKLEQQLWAGTGSSGQLTGFTIMSGSSSESVAGQTLANHATAIAGQFNAIANNLGELPDLIAMAPRRYAYLQSLTAALGLPVENVFPESVRDHIVVSPAAPVALGAGTNEDWILLLNRAAVPLVREGEPTIELHNQGPNIGTNLERRFVIRSYAALGVSRRPEGAALILGATTPSL